MQDSVGVPTSIVTEPGNSGCQALTGAVRICYLFLGRRHLKTLAGQVVAIAFLTSRVQRGIAPKEPSRRRQPTPPRKKSPLHPLTESANNMRQNVKKCDT